MKKNLVKVLTLALAAATVAGMSAMPVFAKTNDVKKTWEVTDSNARTGTITVNGVEEEGVTVTAYQIVKGTYNATGGFSGYALCGNLGANADTALTEEEFKNPSSDKVTAIANAISDDSVDTGLDGVVMTKNGTSYSANVELGLYIVLVTGANTTIYNPAILAVNAEGTVNGSVDMDTSFTGAGTAYVKSSKTGFNKDIVGSSKPTATDTVINPINTEGDTVAFGDKVYFKIHEMKIPSYSKDYTAVQYTIEDNLENGSFSGVNNLVVKVGGSEVAAAVDTYNVYYDGVKADATAVKPGANATSFKVEFTDAYIRAHGNQTVEITYDSLFTDTAGVNYAENYNTATLKYSNDPTNATKTKTERDTTYHYTFGIDADIDAEDETTTGTEQHKDRETFELNKVSQAVGRSAFADFTETGRVSMRNEDYRLQGAWFALYSDAAMTQQVITPECKNDPNGTNYVSSDANGHITFTGLDEGTYYLKEKIAPSTYSLTDDVYKIDIKAELDKEGVMTSYSITTYRSTDGGANYDEETPVGTATYTNGKSGTSYSVDETTGAVTNALSDYKDITPVEIINPKLAGLPSTGGAGTIAITVGAGIGMAGFLTLYIVNKKKKDDEAE